MRRRTRRLVKFLSAGLVGLLFASCSDIGPDEPGVVGVRKDGTVELRNLLPRTVYYFVVDRDYAALINWAPCVNPATCPKVEGKRSASVSVDRIAGYSKKTKEVIVNWWELVPKKDGGFTFDEIRSFVVPLK